MNEREFLHYLQGFLEGINFDNDLVNTETLILWDEAITKILKGGIHAN
jgi:hypothetical protein